MTTTTSKKAPTGAEIAGACASLGIPTFGIPTEVAEAAIQAAKMARLRIEGRSDLEALRGPRLSEAESADVSALASAIAAGTDEPEPVETSRVQGLIFTAERRMAALEQAEGQARADLTNAIYGATEWPALLQAEAEARLEGYRSTVDALANAHADLVTIEAAVAFVSEPEEQQHWNGRSRVPNSDRLTANGGFLMFGDLLDFLSRIGG